MTVGQAAPAQVLTLSTPGQVGVVETTPKIFALPIGHAIAEGEPSPTVSLAPAAGIEGEGVPSPCSSLRKHRYGSYLTLAGIVWRRFTVWRIRRMSRRLHRQIDKIERLWVSIGMEARR